VQVASISTLHAAQVGHGGLRSDGTINVEYGYDPSDALLLERKDDMRRRGPCVTGRWRWVVS
jgi:hypothetical protein